jgi:hypothetical protein
MDRIISEDEELVTGTPEGGTVEGVVTELVAPGTENSDEEIFPDEPDEDVSVHEPESDD